MPEAASDVTISMAGKFMETASAAGLSAADIAIMANNPEVMRGFLLWCKESQPNFFARSPLSSPSKEELRRRLLFTQAKDIFTPETIITYGGQVAPVAIKVSCLMSVGAQITGSRKLPVEDFLAGPIKCLCVITREQALAYPKIGLKTVSVIEAILATHELTLGMDPKLCR